MQIVNIILYSIKGEIRILPFNLGRVNIITGQSKSGKSALIDIIDYCLGSKGCKIAEGVIKDTVKFFAITVNFGGNENYCIVRENPNIKGVASISYVTILPVLESEIPDAELFTSNEDIEGLKGFLSRRLKIAENIQVAENNTRDSLEVNFKHARVFCYQPQGLVAQRDYLFYNQTEPFVPQAIKDSLPYFLGAIREDDLQLTNLIQEKKRKLNQLVRERNEAEKIKSDGVSKAYSLIEEAVEMQLISEVDPKTNIKDIIQILNRVKDWEYKPLDIKEEKGANSVLKKHLDNRQALRDDLGKIEDTISATESFLKNSNSYSGEVSQQKLRLQSIGIYKRVNPNTSECPLCESKLEFSIPSIDQINDSLKELDKHLVTTTAEQPRLAKYLDTLRRNRELIKTEILKAENAVNAIYIESEKIRKVRDLNIRRGRVMGRISLFLESVDFTEDKTLNNSIDALKKEIDQLLKNVDTEDKNDKLSSIINKINLQMSKWVSDLDVEYIDAPIRFDLNKLTLIADTISKPIPLTSMGSGANWVSYHLLIHFALHQHFIQTNRPVPRFLIIDQPSQVYFPPEKDTNEDGIAEKDEDEIAIKQMYDFIIDTTAKLFPNMQVIVTDHAYLRNDKFTSCITEVWRGDKKLIPKEWYS